MPYPHAVQIRVSTGDRLDKLAAAAGERFVLEQNETQLVLKDPNGFKVSFFLLLLCAFPLTLLIRIYIYI